MLPLLAVLNVVSLGGSLRLRGYKDKGPDASEVDGSAGESPSPVTILRESAYLRNLAIVVALAAATSGLLDYVFSAEATKVYASGRALLSFFALFWLGVGVVSLALQLYCGRIALEKLGLAMTVALLPAVVVLGGAVGLAVPGLWTTAILRGGEATQRNSLFRMAYEMLYTPVSERRKRAMKTLIDVGFDRLGTVAAAGVTIVVIALFSRRAEVVLLTAAIAFAMISLVRSHALHTGYVALLEESLRKGAEAVSQGVPPAAPEKVEARERIVERLEGLSADAARAGDNGTDEAIWDVDGWLAAIADLRSHDASRMRRVLSMDALLPRPLVAFAILVLADKEFHQEAIGALRKGVSKTTGQLVDALCDADVDFDIRRRIPRVLSACATRDAVDGLILGTADERFEVRYQCGRALSKIQRTDATLPIPTAAVIAIVGRELARSKDVSESQPTADLDEDENEPPTFVDRLLGDRISRGIEHVFTLLSLVLDRESLRLAFMALHEEDQHIRGTALEYLETVLPDEIRDAIWPFLGEARPLKAARPAAEILADLRRASATPEHGLADLVSA